MGKRISNLKCNTLRAYRELDVRGKEHGKYFGQFWGAGIVGTGSPTRPQKWQWKENGMIVTEYRIDITGLACKGDAANDVIGLAAGGAAYIDRYDAALHGLLFRAEAHCVEAPGQGTATITANIDMAFNSSAVLAYDGAAGAAEVAWGAHAIGTTFVDEAVAPTDDDYIYLVEGDTTASTGVYNAGKLIIRLYGALAFS